MRNFWKYHWEFYHCRKCFYPLRIKLPQNHEFLPALVPDLPERFLQQRMTWSLWLGVSLFPSFVSLLKNATHTRILLLTTEIKIAKRLVFRFTFRHTSPPVQNLSHVFESTVDHTFLMEQLMEARLKDDTTAKEAQAGHPAKSSKPREFNYRVHFIHWRKSLY